MGRENDWETIRSDHGVGIEKASGDMLRMTLLFGSAALVLALLVASFVQNSMGSGRSGPGAASLDRMTTGTVRARSPHDAYTIRRSVLQSSPSAVCIIRENGARAGDC